MWLENSVFCLFTVGYKGNLQSRRITHHLDLQSLRQKNPALFTASSCHYCIWFWYGNVIQDSWWDLNSLSTKWRKPDHHKILKCNCFSPYHQLILIWLFTVKHRQCTLRNKYSLQVLLIFWLFSWILTAKSVTATPDTEHHWGTHWFCTWAENTTSVPPPFYIIL